MASISFTSDRPTDTDALGRADFARSLAYALLSVSGHEGLVVGIEGDWGAGKSTILGFVKKHLEEITESSAMPVLVDFNPWILSNTGAQVDALVTQIAAALSVRSVNQANGIKASKKLLNYIGLLKHLKHLRYFKDDPHLGWIGQIADDGAPLIDVTTAGAKEAQTALSQLESTLPKLDIAARKKEVVDALKTFGRPIIVVVDDLDRLPPDEIRSLVQTIKAVADFPRTTYLMAYDRNIVSNALGNGNAAAGMSYLEKIVQVAYPIPPLFQFQMIQFVEAQLKELLSKLGVKVRDYEESRYLPAVRIATSLMRQPRDVVRLMNRLVLSAPATHGEVNICDVIVFEALSQRFPTIRDRVHRNPSDFVGQPFRGDADQYSEMDWMRWAYDSNELKREYGDQPRWEVHIPEDTQESKLVKKALQFIFSKEPELDGALEDHLRMGDPDRLARYFRMTSLDAVPEVAFIHALLRNPLQLEDALAKESDLELATLLDWISNFVPSTVAIDAPGSLQVLATASQTQFAENKLSSELSVSISKVMQRILRRAPHDVRAEALLKNVELAPLSISQPVLLSAVAEQGKWIGAAAQKKDIEHQLVDDQAAVDSAKDLWIAKVREAASNNKLINEPRLHGVLQIFGDFCLSYTEAFQIVDSICQTESGLKKFLSVYVQDSPFNDIYAFKLVEDPQVLISRIENSSFKEEYAWLMNLLASTQTQDMIREHAIARLNLRGKGQT